MTAGARRATAGVAVAVVAALVLLLVLRASGGSQPGAAGTAAAGLGAGQQPAGSSGRPRPAGSSASAAATAPARPGTAATHPDPLSTAAASFAASRSGSVQAAVFDLRTGQSWRLGDGPAQPEASVVKLDILEALLAQRGAALPSDEQGLAQAMIEDSDNDAATSLWDEAGGAAGLAAYNDRAGLTGTTLSQCVTCAGFPWPGWGLTTTGPADQLTLLKQLVAPGAHPLLPPAARSYALSLMEHVAADQAWGVSGGVPPGLTVALKNGWLPLNSADTDWQVNSVGWVSGDGRDYLVAVLSTGNPTEQYGIDTISQLSALIWSAMR